MTCGLYCITNKINGKKYFGQSINIEIRKKAYFNYGDFPNDHIKNAFNKYGKENFEFKIIKVCKEKYLNRFEKLYIRINDTQNPNKGYNKESGGNPNKHLSEETKQKMSEAKCGENHPQYRDDIDDKEIIDLYENQGLSERKIAEKLNCGRYIVHSRLKANGVEIRDRSNENHYMYRDDIDDKEIIDLYENQGLSQRKIAKKLNCSKCLVQSRLKANDVDTTRKIHNKSGYYRVSKNKCPSCKQGFRWMYSYQENGKTKAIYSVDLKKLEIKVKEKGLTWKKL